MNRTWTDHEMFLAQTLACRVKLARGQQLKTMWALAPFGRAPFELDEALERLDWAIERHSAAVHPPLEPVCPVLALGADEVYPEDLRPHSRLMRLRWNKPAVRSTVFVATKRAANLFGSRAGGLPPHEHRNHDLLLTDAFLHHLRRDPEAIDEWVGEQMLDKAGYRIKDPDAFRLRPDGTAYQVIESGGSYSATQLASLCEYARQRCLGLEVW